MYIKLLTAAAMLVASTSVLAITEKPDHCPSIGTLLAAGLPKDNVINQQNGNWSVFTGLRDGDASWIFAIMNISAMDDNDAHQKAVLSLNSLTYLQGPFSLQIATEWACLYSTAEGYEAVTVTGEHNLQNQDRLLTTLRRN